MKIKQIKFLDTIDSDGDMEVVFTNGDSEESMWINKDEAVEIIAHLKSKFELDVTPHA